MAVVGSFPWTKAHEWNKNSTARAWTDPDDAPDLSTPEWAAKLAVTPVRRGRPLAAKRKCRRRSTWTPISSRRFANKARGGKPASTPRYAIGSTIIERGDPLPSGEGAPLQRRRPRSLATHRRAGPVVSRDAIYAVIEETNAQETQGAPSIEHLCQLGRVSRAGFYRFGEVREPQRTEADLRDKTQTIALENRFYGHRRVCRDLWRIHGLKVNHKHVLRLMPKKNLLCLRQKPFVPYITNSRHEFPIVPNLTRDLVPTGLDQIWVADITYVRLAEQFVYLAVVLDAFSRKVIGWALADHLEASLAIEALDMALIARNPKPGLIHHSDRGVQYACADYREKLTGRGVLISMSRAGNPYDNAKAERFMRTLKEEEVNAKTYASIDEARTDIGLRLPRKRL